MKADKQLPTEISSFAPDANHRRLILWFLTWYDVIVSLIVSLIMVLTVGPIVPTYSIFLLWPITYIGYACLRLLSIYSGSQSSHRTISKFSTTRIALADVAHLVSSVNATYENSKLHSRWPRLRSRAHSLALLAIALIFAIQVRTAAVSLHLPPDVDGSLWLLLTPSIRAASRKDSITWLVAIFGLAAIGNAIIHVFTSQHSVFLLLQGGATQTLWLLSICLLPALLARYISAREKDISDREKALEAALDVIKGIANILDLPAQRFPNEAASLIARRFAFDEVNILFATTQDDDVGEGLLFGGASSVNGQVLVDSGYVIPRHTNAESNRGITTWAAVHKEPCLVNDVWNHPAQLFLYSDQFPDTASELAIPILLGNEIVGVLDIQSKSTA
ncbi:MAG TPA: GAF domain-containing protein, partial [Ktedonobacteraceae bacterium]|nr:GAF domain-containing protein [Ktedonobacteraceae bacterium]